MPKHTVIRISTVPRGNENFCYARGWITQSQGCSPPCPGQLVHRVTWRRPPLLAQCLMSLFHQLFFPGLQCRWGNPLLTGHDSIAL